jgi:hypothetical protein
MIELFSMGDNYMVTLNKEWISTIPEFRAILARDKGGPTDGSGRFKKQATREFTYIFHTYDFRSPFENYSVEDRKLEVETMTGMTAADSEKDEVLLEAIERYKQFLSNCSKTLRGVRSMKRAIDAMWDHFDTVDYEVADMIKIQASITNMPKTLEALKKLEEQVKQEMDGDTGMRGDAEKGHEEDPV